MNNIEIARIIRNDPILKQYFGGIYFLHDIPIPTSYPIAYVVNLGKHWVALYFNNKNQCEYYDSLGRKPPEVITKKLHISVYNNIQIQPLNSQSCGQFVIYYLYFRVRCVSMKNIINNLIKYPAARIVEDFVMELINEQFKIYMLKSINKLC